MSRRARWRATIRSWSCSPTKSASSAGSRASRPSNGRSRRRFPHRYEEGRSRLFRRPRHVRRRRLAQGAVRRRGRDVDGRSRRRVAARRRRAARHVRRCLACLRDRCARALHHRLRLAAPPGQCAVPGRLPAGDGARQAAHRPTARGGRPTRRRRRRRARLHRQGQRPGPVRRRDPCARSGARGRRPDARGHGPDPRPGDRLRQRAWHRDPDHQGSRPTRST